jgi:hypothetical protein
LLKLQNGPHSLRNWKRRRGHVVGMSENVEQILLDAGNLLALIRIRRRRVFMGGVLRSELKHRVPMVFVEYGVSDLPEARSEQFVVDAMELGGDVASLEIKDLPNSGMMLHGLTKVHPTARSLLPFG